MARGKSKPKIPDEVGTGEMASILGITTRRLGQLVMEGVLEKRGRGSFNVAESVQAFVDFKVRAEVSRLAPSAANRLQERKEQLLAMRISRDERTLIDLSEATDAVDAVVGTFLETLSILPARISRDPTERKRIETICDAERQRISDSFAKTAQTLRTGISPDEADIEDDV